MDAEAPFNPDDLPDLSKCAISCLSSQMSYLASFGEEIPTFRQINLCYYLSPRDQHLHHCLTWADRWNRNASTDAVVHWQLKRLWIGSGNCNLNPL
jgi:hypothetical protein